jgi:RimJ/RimL family protein N-acetyltransferase
MSKISTNAFEFQGHELPSESLEETKAIMLQRMPSAEEPGREDYAILLKPSAHIAANEKLKMIGFIGIRRIAGDACIVGYSIHPDYSGSGYATEALISFTESYGKSMLNLQHLFAFTLFFLSLIRSGLGYLS